MSKKKEHVFIDGIECKECSVCKNILPLEHFTKNKGTTDGLRARCRECDNKDQAIYKSTHRDELHAYSKIYREENRATVDKKRREYMHKFRTENPEIAKERQHTNYTKHKDARLSYVCNYMKTEKGKEVKRIQTNKRRARIKKLLQKFNISDWEKCKMAFDNRCAYCGKELVLEQEHFIPTVMGGEYTSNNIIPACRSCNSSKNNRDFFDWYIKQPFYSKQREHKILKYLNYDPITKTQQLALIK